MKKLRYTLKERFKLYFSIVTCSVPEAVDDMKHISDLLDLEEQGLLLKLPCKVGTPVWTIVCGITGKNPSLFRQDFEIAMIQYWGTAVFLTKEEAEEALRKKVE